MNGDYGSGLGAFERLSAWSLWIGVAVLACMVGVAIWLAVRAEQ